MLPGHLSAHAASFAADEFDRPDRQRLGCDRRAGPAGFASGGRAGGAGADRPGLRAGSARLVDGGRQPAPLLGGDACASPRSEKWGASTRRLRYVVDWDCWLRLSRKWPVAWLARPTVQVRWHPASETHRFKTGLADLDETARMLETLFGLDLKDHADSGRSAPRCARSPGAERS